MHLILFSLVEIEDILKGLRGWKEKGASVKEKAGRVRRWRRSKRRVMEMLQVTMVVRASLALTSYLHSV